MRIAIEYGRRELAFRVPSRRLRGVVQPKDVRALADVHAAVRRALARPVGTPSLPKVLAGAGTALILVPDHTRPSPRPTLLPMLDACARRGVQPTLCVAIGRHRAMTPAELKGHLGRDVIRRSPVVQHDPFDRQAHVRALTDIDAALRLATLLCGPRAPILIARHARRLIT